MQFKIGTRAYNVRRRWSLSCDGERVQGLCSYVTRTLWLDGELSDEMIVDVLRHEHVHAWEAEVGATRGDEDHANFIATVSDAFDEQFTAQGGRTALLALPVEGTRPEGRQSSGAPMRYLNVSDRIECGKCGAQVMVGSIFKSEPRLLDGVGVFIVDRGFQCPVCENVQVWEERSTDAGVPIGEFYNVRLLRGEDAERWLTAHAALHCPYNAT